jgi:lysophospholipase L1-like esterase
MLQNTVQNSVSTIGGPADNNGRDTYAARITNCAGTDYALILYGTNDIYTNDPAYSAALYGNDLEEIIAGLAAAGMSLDHVVIGGPPFVTNYGAVGSDAVLLAYVAAAGVAAGNAGCLYANVYQYMADNGGAALLSPDGIHPNDAGHAAIAAAFLAVL